MFKSEKNLKSTFCSFFQDFSHFGASLKLLPMMCHTATKTLRTFAICDNRLCWWTPGMIMNKSMLDLYKKLDLQER